VLDVNPVGELVVYSHTARVYFQFVKQKFNE